MNAPVAIDDLRHAEVDGDWACRDDLVFGQAFDRYGKAMRLDGVVRKGSREAGGVTYPRAARPFVSSCV